MIPEILVIGSYPPRECGIATYTQDLLAAIERKFGESFILKVCALEAKGRTLNYPSEVKYVLDIKSADSYQLMADRIEQDPAVSLLLIQHEFGLFEGHYGVKLLQLLYSVSKPIVVSMHTVLPNPDNDLKKVVRAIDAVSGMLIVMTLNSKNILVNDYALDPSKIVVIPHGTHLIASPSKESIKERFDLDGTIILSTFGLMSQGKSIETALYALPEIIDKFPNVLYLVLGKTHPEVVRSEGESYRMELEAIVMNLGLQKHVQFVNRYLSLDYLLEYLEMTDIYLFTSKDPMQAVSGTMSYAMGCSCPVISTPIPHAKEMLRDEAGVIVDFQDSQQLATEVINLLSDAERRRRIRLNALHRIRPTCWENAAIEHALVFSRLLGVTQRLNYAWPALSLDHLKRMTTERGLVQFAKIYHPDLESGYTLDDNARALIAAIMHYEKSKEPADLVLVDIYLKFIKDCQQSDGRFLNYVDREGKFHEKNKHVNLEDSMGRAIWALGELLVVSTKLELAQELVASALIEKSLSAIQKLQSPRAIAFAIKGLYHYNTVRKSKDVEPIIEALGEKLVTCYYASSDITWSWFEEYLTYANSVLPEALLMAHLATGNRIFKHIAKSSFDFLLGHLFHHEEIRVISNRGWQNKGEGRSRFGEQPIDVAYTIFALSLFYECFQSEKYRKHLSDAFAWFHGKNHLHQIIYNPATGGCCDGLEEFNVNLNQGAESTVCYLMAHMTMELHKQRVEAEEEEVSAPLHLVN